MIGSLWRPRSLGFLRADMGSPWRILGTRVTVVDFCCGQWGPGLYGIGWEGGGEEEMEAGRMMRWYCHMDLCDFF